MSLEWNQTTDPLQNANEVMKAPSEDWDELRLLTVKEAAGRLGCSAGNIYGLIESGDLAVVNVGRRKGYRIDLRDLDTFIQSRKHRMQPRRAPAPEKRLKHLKL